MSKFDGRVTEIEEKGNIWVVKISKADKKKSSVEYTVSRGIKLYVEKGDNIKKGQLISEGPIDPQEMLKYQGIDKLQHYIVNEVQKVYVPEGAA